VFLSNKCLKFCILNQLMVSLSESKHGKQLLFGISNWHKGHVVLNISVPVFFFFLKKSLQ
jgi:hypothetical protein